MRFVNSAISWQAPPTRLASWARPARRVATRTAVTVLLLANAAFMISAWQGLLFGVPVPPDWQGLVDASGRIAAGLDPYIGQTYGFRWSPVAAWLLVPVVAIGLLVWQVAHVAALALLPKRLAALTLACFAFWVDVAMGNVVVFGFVLAYLALSGRRSGVIAFTVFALLVPRPLYIPILLWLWLKEPGNRWSITATGVVVAVLTLATGYAGSWIDVLLRSGHDIINATNMAPSRIVGYAWVPFAIVGSAWAFRRGWLGTASLFASPYWLPYYFVMLLLDLKPRPQDRTEPAPN